MSLHVKVRYPRINIQASKEAIDKHMSEQVLEALRTWVIAVTNQVPVWTGASKASFLRLAFEVSVGLTIIPRAPVSRIQFGFETSTGEIIRKKGTTYGWVWRSELDYIQIVDRYNSFLAAGESALQNIKIKELPQPVIRVQEGR